MKKLLTNLMMLIGISSFGQVLEVPNINIPLPQQSLGASVNSGVNLPESSSCGPDTNGYALAKATGLEALNINNSTSASAASQYFDAPQSLTISGVSFYAWKADLTNGASMSVNVEIYAAALDSTPTGLPLVSTTVTLDTTYAPGTLDVLRKHANFTTALTVSSAYVVVISNPTSTPLSLIFNSWNAADGDQEWLSSALIGTTWLRGYALNIGGVPLDADCLFEPHVSYTLDADFTIDNPCFINGNTLNLTNNTSAVATHRMYSIAAFQQVPQFSFTWDYGDGSLLENLVDATHTYSFPGVYPITLSDTLFGWTNNCFDSETKSTGTVVVATWTSTNTLLTTSFTTTTPPPSIDSTFWDFGDGQTSTLINPSHTYTTGGSYNVCLIVYSSCGSDTSCTAVNIVCPTPSVGFTEVNNNLTSTFTNSSAGSGTMTYLWDFGDGNTSTLIDPTHTYATAGTYTVCLIATDACNSDTSCTTVNLVCPTPTTGFTSANTNLTVTFTNSTSGAGTTNYVWDFGDGNTSTTMNPTHTYAADGIYTVCLIATNGCGSDTSCVVINVVNCINPTASFTSTGTGASFIFSNTSTTIGTTTVAWDFGDGNNSTSTNPTHTYLTNGSFIVSLTVTDSCGTNTFTQTVMSAGVGIDELAKEDIVLYPNPANEALQVLAVHPIQSIELFDLAGKRVYVSKLNATSSHQIDIKAIANGVYTVTIQFESGALLNKRVEILH